MTINCREEEEARFGGKESKKVGEDDKDTGKGKSFDICITKWYIFNPKEISY